MLHGKIQSGKTRAFVGVIARAFDRGFDIAIVFTKGTKTLSAQTVVRLGSDLREFIDEDEILVFDRLSRDLRPGLGLSVSRTTPVYYAIIAVTSSLSFRGHCKDDNGVLVHFCKTQSVRANPMQRDMVFQRLAS